MSVISFGKFLGTKESEQIQRSMVGLVQGMLQTLATEAVHYNEQRVKAYREELEGLVARITPETGAESAAFVAEAFTRLVRENSRGIEHILREQGDELRSLAKLITRSLSSFAEEDEGTQTSLKDLQKDLEGVSSLRDIVQFKSRLRASLEHLQQTAEHRKKQNAAVLAELQRELQESRARLAQLSVDPTKDPVTGLPIREDAINVLSFLSGRDGLAFAMVLCVQQLPGLNAKFGHQVGNAVLQHYRDHLTRCMGDCGRLFRWGGKCMVAIFSKAEIARSSASDLIRSLGTSANLEIDTGSRTILIPVSPKWLAVGRGEILSGPQITERIDRFAAEC